MCICALMPSQTSEEKYISNSANLPLPNSKPMEKSTRKQLCRNFPDFWTWKGLMIKKIYISGAPTSYSGDFDKLTVIYIVKLQWYYLLIWFNWKASKTYWLCRTSLVKCDHRYEVTSQIPKGFTAYNKCFRRCADFAGFLISHSVTW